MIVFSKHLEERLFVKEGESVVLECELFNPRFDVIWLKGDRKLYPSDKFKISEKGSLRSLTIIDSVKYDQAVYSCALKHDLQRFSSSAIDVDSSMFVSFSISSYQAVHEFDVACCTREFAFYSSLNQYFVSRHLRFIV